ncbi:hypothetical protein Y032_0012g1764 [Ancylostoma ceylanicum]|uniref:Uncharacterized protein n=2 Tax=Ancylostoma ceylanicum TaxID=53326 RepID=A0A016VDV2_9BILA|nr:hypothetical protein Y032_0012g1764 [Ancylostoma ceylanicum]
MNAAETGAWERMLAQHLAKMLPEKPSDVESRTRRHLINLFRDGALPSPIASALCSDKSCYACYVALELLSDNKHITNGDVKNAMAFAAYLEKDHENDLAESNNAQSVSEEGKVVRAGEIKCKLYGAWKASVSPELKRSLAVGNSPPSARRKRNLDFVKETAHNDGCYSCRSIYDSLYQEFSLYRYPQKPNELGAPVLRSGTAITSLADGALVARIFHIYVNGRKLPVLTDVILLELVDSSATTLADFWTLQLTGFVHRVEANGTDYFARGTIFCDVELMSACMIEAAVTVRAIALNCASQSRKIVSCAGTIRKWLTVMGLDKKGFTAKPFSSGVT